MKKPELFPNDLIEKAISSWERKYPDCIMCETDHTNIMFSFFIDRQTEHRCCEIKLYHFKSYHRMLKRKSDEALTKAIFDYLNQLKSVKE